MDDFERSFQKIRAILREKKWPGVEEGQSWGTPSLKVKGKMLFRVREPGVGVLMCNLEAKEMLMQVAPHIYFEIPHYKGYPAVLVHLDVIEYDELAEMIEEYWRKIAPKKLVAEFETLDQSAAPSPPAKAASLKATRPKSKSKAAPEESAEPKSNAGAKTNTPTRKPASKAKTKR